MEASFPWIDDAIERVGFGRFQRTLMVVCIISWMADGMQPILVSFLIPEFDDASDAQKSLLGSAVFIGMFFGSFTWGHFADERGRRPALLWTVFGTVVGSVVCSFMPDINWLIVSQILLGFMVGGNLPVVYSLFVEFLPTRRRGVYLTILAAAWSVGELLVTGLAWGIMGKLGWRWLLRLSGLPCLLVFLFLKNILETPRFLAVHGKIPAAVKVLNAVSVTNTGKSCLNEEDVIEPESDERDAAADMLETAMKKKSSLHELKDKVASLFSPSLKKLTIYLWVIWFVGSFGLYGVLEFLPSFFEKKGMVKGSTYERVFITGLGNIPGIIVASYLVESSLGRRKTIAVFSGLCGASIAFLTSAESWEYIVGAVLVTKFFLYGAWAAIDTYTPEAYPTSVRSIGNAAASCLARTAGIISPPLNVYFLKLPMWAITVMWAGAMFITAIVAAMLPTETRGTQLADFVGQNQSQTSEREKRSEDERELLNDFESSS